MKTVWNIALGFLVLSSPGATVTQGHRLPDQKAVQHLERLLVTEADSRAGSDTAKNRADRPVTVSSSVMELSRIERSDLPGALFEIPEGYREGKSGLKDVLKW